MKPTSFILETLLAIKEVISEHDSCVESFDTVETNLKNAIQKVLNKDHNGDFFQKLSLIADNSNEIEDLIDSLKEISKDSIEKQKVFLTSKEEVKEIQRLLALITDPSQVEFYKLPSLKKEILKAVRCLYESFSYLEFPSMEEQTETLWEIVDSFDKQMNPYFHTSEDEHMTLKDLREVMNDICSLNTYK
jgi:hypothetical protein